MRYLHSLLFPLALLAAPGCSGSTPSKPEDCAGLSAGKSRDECFLSIVQPVFKKDAEAGIAMVEKEIADPVTKDFAWYTVTKDVDPASNKYCDRIKDQTLAGRCRQIVSRPHLHRGLTGADATPSGMRTAPDHNKPADETHGAPNPTPPGAPAP
jgi:hypothetical protein